MSLTGFQGGGRGGGPSTPQPDPVALPPAVIDARLTDNSLDQVTQGLAKLKIQGGGGELPVRPGFGTLGKAIKLRANYFAVQKFPAFLYEYEVKVGVSLLRSNRYMASVSMPCDLSIPLNLDRARDQNKAGQGGLHFYFSYPFQTLTSSKPLYSVASLNSLINHPSFLNMHHLLPMTGHPK